MPGDAGGDASPKAPSDLGVSDDPLILTDEERAALVALLKRTLDYTHYPLAPRLDPLKAILARLDPQPPRPELRPPQPAAGPRVGRGRQRR
jgi:hypothetical protein